MSHTNFNKSVVSPTHTKKHNFNLPICDYVCDPRIVPIYVKQIISATARSDRWVR